MLELSSEGTSATLRQVIEGKLMELDHEPRNIQVIVGSADSRLYLVDESGIVRRVSEHVSLEDSNTHVNNNNTRVTNETEALREELQEARLENEGLREQVHERDQTLRAVRSTLETANAELQDSRTELDTLRRDLRVQTARAK